VTTACYVLFNEEQHIAESIRSIKAFVDHIVVVDGAFSTNPAGPGPSTDSTRAQVERVCGATRLTYITTSNLAEHEARNLALTRVDAGDWVLAIDGDEVFYGDFTKVLFEGTDVALRIYTTAVLFDGNADAMDEETYWTNPVVSTGGQQPRFFRNAPKTGYARKTVNDQSFVHLYRRDEEIVGTLVEGAFIINRHVAQPFAGYLADFAWETAQLVAGE
jgi:glycosyltransferase involved in cell wall biosynthesis